jgi:hypothetical protein
MFAICRFCQTHCDRRGLRVGVPLFAGVRIDWFTKIDEFTILFPSYPTPDEIREAGIWEDDIFVVKVQR